MTYHVWAREHWKQSCFFPLPLLSAQVYVHFSQPVKWLYLRLFCRHVPRGGITPTGEGFPLIKRLRDYRQTSVNAHILKLIGNILTVQHVPRQKHRDGCCHLFFSSHEIVFPKTHTQKKGKLRWLLPHLQAWKWSPSPHCSICHCSTCFIH